MAFWHVEADSSAINLAIINGSVKVRYFCSKNCHSAEYGKGSVALPKIRQNGETEEIFKSISAHNVGNSAGYGKGSAALP